MIEAEVPILLVEDNPADARLILEAMKETPGRPRLWHVADGAEALACLHREGPWAGRPRPALILLDLNLPGMDGRDLLARIKSDERLKRIPVVVLTGSAAEQDVLRAYNLHANCYISKPADFDQFVRVVRAIQEFWLTVARLPGP